MTFGTQRIVYIGLLWGAWACAMARVLSMRVSRGRRPRVRPWTISMWEPILVAVGLILSLILRPAYSGTYPLLDSHDRFVAMCVGYILVAGFSARQPSLAKAVKVTWGVGGILVGAAALLGLGGPRAVIVPLSLRAPLFSLSSLAVSAAVGIVLLAVVGEGIRLWGAHWDLDPTAGEVISRVAIEWAAVAVATALLLGGFGGFLAWGACWSWDPVELWYLSLGLLYAFFLHGGLKDTAGGLWRWVVLSVALTFSVFVLFGAGYLVRELGLASRLAW